MENSSPVKKSKKRKQESDVESVIFVNEQPKKKKKTKSLREVPEEEVQNDETELEQVDMLTPTKNNHGGKTMVNSCPVKQSKKRKQESDVESVIFVNEQPKKKNKTKSLREVPEEEVQNDETDLEQVDMLTPTKNNHGGESVDSWSKEEYLELVKRIQAQIPKNDMMGFTTRIEKLDWSQIQFGNHSIDECYEVWKLMRSKVRHFRLLDEVLQDVKVWVENPWVSLINKKKVRHPEQPARPLSSFMLFYMDKKNKIMKRNPGLKLTDISRLIGEKYKVLSDAKRGYYIEKAKLMQEEYKQNLSKFYEKYPELMNVPKTSKKHLLEANSRKKPLPPIKLYLKDKLEKHQNDEDFNQHDFSEKYKNVWKHSLSKKKKAYWIRIAKEEEEKYLEWLHDEEADAKPSYKSVISKDELAILDRLAGKPEKPPNSAYSLFSRLMLQDKDQNYVEGAPKNRMKEVAIKWRELPEENKRVYAERVQHMHDTYKLEMANYLESLPEDKKAEELAKLQTKKKNKTKTRTTKSVPKSDTQSPDLFKNEPAKPPATAWDLYKSEYARKNPSLPNKIATKHAADLWKSLAPKQVEKYNKKYQMLKQKYMDDFEAFLKSLNEEELKEYSTWKNAKHAKEKTEENDEDDSSSEQEDENGSSSSSSSDEDSGVSNE